MRLLLSAPGRFSGREIQTELGIPLPRYRPLEKLKNEGLVRMRRESTFLWYTGIPLPSKNWLGFLYAECCTRNKALKPEAIVSNLQIGDTVEIKDIVKEKYGQAALRSRPAAVPACGASPQRILRSNPSTSTHQSNLRVPDQAVKPRSAAQPPALAKLNPGETCSNLGSGGGIDVLLSARRVGPNWQAFGWI